ncbi:hypothetical protein C4585_02910 [Candidatus Parcubacteria bacterium]|nr:MAG: hypothetical protein C4585_02910 [Candidatus Parcubacteria bacterium]
MIKKSEKKEKERSVLIILDTHAILHRAYHAIPDFSSSKGEPTGALYGLTAMLLKTINELKPEYIVAARDLPGSTVRHELFEAYKAKRIKAEPELIRQLERAPEVFKAFGIPVYASPGFEADDIIGTIVRQVREEEDSVDIIISTGDMDTLQLVEDKRVQVYTLRKGLNDTVLYDEDRVRERYGFGPEHVIDYKALRGDPSDNIPGIRGIGEKTAVELIQAFGSLESIYEVLEKKPERFAQEGIKQRTIDLLRHGGTDAAFSKQLASIRTDVPIVFGIPKEKWQLKDHAKDIATLCDEFEFRSLKSRLGAADSVKKEELDGQATLAFAETVPNDALKETAIALWLLQSDLTNPTIDDMLHYAKAKNFEKAREYIFSQLKETGRLYEVYEHIERPLMPVVNAMNARGVYVDVKHMKELSREYGRELGNIAGRIFKYAGREFNINSPKQLGGVLFDELKITPARQKKTSTGARTTREGELAKMLDLHPIVADILSYRELQKLLSTYIQKIPGLVGSDSRLRAEFLQTGTTTGRMSSQNPNLQNIPIKSEYGRRIREAFAAPKGRILAAIDYSQIELRIAAGLSGDKKLGEVFKQGGDIHRAVAAEVFDVSPDMVDYEMRRRAKVINFGILYGMGVNALRETLGAGVTRDEAAKYLADYFKNFSGLAKWIEKTKAHATATGYTETLFGRRRYFPGLKSAMPNLRAQAERMAVNAPIQGTQSDIIKLAMIEADALIEKKGWREKAGLVLQVHDELVYEIDENEAPTIAQELRRVMESVVSSEKLHGVPIVAETALGSNWGSMKKI